MTLSAPNKLFLFSIVPYSSAETKIFILNVPLRLRDGQLEVEAREKLKMSLSLTLRWSRESISIGFQYVIASYLWFNYEILIFN